MLKNHPINVVYCCPKDEAVIEDQENVDLAKEVFDVGTKSEPMLKTLVSALVKAIAETL